MKIGFSEDEFLLKFKEIYLEDYNKCMRKFLQEEKTKPGKHHPMQHPDHHIKSALRSYLSRIKKHLTMKKIIILISLVITLLTSYLETYAYDFENNGLYYKILSTGDLTCSLVEGNNTYEGDLVIPDQVEYMGKSLSVISIDCSLEYISSITFNDLISSVPKSCFENNEKIEDIILPININLLEDKAFFGCSNIKKIIVEGTPEMKKEVFSNCENLNEVIWISDMVLGEGIFKNCYNLNTLNYGSICTSIPDEAFKNCNFIKLELSDLESIGKSSFEGCTNLNNLLLKSILFIGDNAFSNCGNIENLYIGNKINEIKYNSWKNCNIEYLHIEDSTETLIMYDSSSSYFYKSEQYPGNPSWYYYPPIFYETNIDKLYLGRNTFGYQNSTSRSLYASPFIYNKMTVVTLGEYFTDLPRSSGSAQKDEGRAYGYFEGCELLSECIFITSSINIERDCFRNTNITKLKLPETNFIGSEAFTYTTNLKEVEFGKNLTLKQAFNVSSYYGDDTPYTSKIERITFNSKYPPAYDYELWWQYSPTTRDLPPFSQEQYLSIKLIVPYGSINYYRESEPWRNFWYIEEMPGVEAEQIILNVEEAKINIGETLQLEATVIPGDTTDKTIIWNSSDLKVASVNEAGLVTAISSGTAVITASCGNVSATCLITVTTPIIDANQIILNLEYAEMNIGETVQLEATILPEDTTDKSLSWNSSDSNVARVSDNGLVSVISAGTAIITATCGEVSAECVITVLDEAGIGSIFSENLSGFSILSINGILIKKDCTFEDLQALTKGLYIIKSNDKVYKIVL